MKPDIAFIGGGNMAASLIGGMVAGGRLAASLLVSEPGADRRSRLEAEYGITTTDRNADALDAGTVVLAVKPQILQSVCRELASHDGADRPLYISIAAGIRSHDIERWLTGDRTASIALVRSMPNTPALLQCGATALFVNEHVSKSQQAQAEAILAAAGITCRVDDESMLDAVTALSGSGPAYFFLLMEAMQQAAQRRGLDAGTAARLTMQTALGAARMASESGATPTVLRERVTSPGGTTEAAISRFTQSGFTEMVDDALGAAYERSTQIALEMGKDEP